MTNPTTARDYYTVTIRKQFPSWDEKNGIVYQDVTGRSKSEAIANARFRARNAGHTGDSKTSGRAIFSAVKQDAYLGTDLEDRSWEY